MATERENNEIEHVGGILGSVAKTEAGRRGNFLIDTITAK